jgi:hypothetical protein
MGRKGKISVSGQYYFFFSLSQDNKWEDQLLLYFFLTFSFCFSEAHKSEEMGNFFVFSGYSEQKIFLHYEGNEATYRAKNYYQGFQVGL